MLNRASQPGYLAAFQATIPKGGARLAGRFPEPFSTEQPGCGVSWRPVWTQGVIPWKRPRSPSPRPSPPARSCCALKAGVKLIAAGESPGAASRKLGFTANHLRILRRRYPEVWEAALQDTRHNAAATKPEVGAAAQ